MAVMSDKKSNGVQYSKVIVLLCVLVGIAGAIGTAILSIVATIPEAVLVALVGFFGAIATTSVVFYLKKAQSENSVRMYVEAYKEIAEIKGDNSMLDGLGDTMVEKMTGVLDTTLEDGTSLIEKQDISSL